LRKVGHDVTFAAPENCKAEITSATFPCHTISQPLLSARGKYLPREGFWRTSARSAERARASAQKIAADGISEVLQSLHPDLVLADCEHHSAILQSLASGHRLALLSFMYFTPPSAQAPPLTSSQIPGVGVSGSPLAVRYSWASLRRRKTRKLRRAKRKHWGADMATAHRFLAQLLGVDLSRITSQDAFQMPWSYTLLTLLLVAPSADFPTIQAPHQKFLGPMIRNRHGGSVISVANTQTGSPSARSDTADPRLAAFFNAANAGPRIYAVFGSRMQPPLRFVRRLREVAERNPTWQILIANKGLDQPTVSAKIGVLPANLSFVEWAPQLDVLVRADCAIFHGGAGTFGECLLTRTPMMIYPNNLDGPGNAARATFHKLGRMGSYRDGASKIETDIRTLLQNTEIADALARHHKATFGAIPSNLSHASFLVDPMQDAYTSALPTPENLIPTIAGLLNDTPAPS
jgi:UDP:flavonoid glycosyltransferase YjiC (YdhE family)